MLISEIYIILNNLLIRMEEAGAVDEDENGEDSKLIVIKHFMMQDNMRLQERGEVAVAAFSALHVAASTA